MYKSIFILYAVCFFCYIYFTREPDYFDAETAPATIHWQTDSINTKPIPKAVFIVNKESYAVDARYVFRSLPEGKNVEVIYNTSHPSTAAVNNWWGYWIRWQEWAISIVLIVALFQVAVAVTNNPTAESLLEQIEGDGKPKRKYND